MLDSTSSSRMTEWGTKLLHHMAGLDGSHEVHRVAQYGITGLRSCLSVSWPFMCSLGALQRGQG
jgi:hypothetical protein